MKHSLYEKQQQLVVVFSAFFIFCGFNTIYEWGKENFKQAPRHDQDFIKQGKKHIRTVNVYNGLTIEAQFHTLLLTDGARMLYVDYHGNNRGFSSEQIKGLKQRQINENRNFISMYVVAWNREREYTNSKSLFTGEGVKTGSILKGEDALWNVSLIVGGKRYLPETIKVVDIPLEYQMFFAEHLNLFSNVYLVRFAAKDSQNNYIFPQDKCSAVIDFCSPRYRVQAIYKGINFYLNN
jgi:hypothetical protein